MEISSFELGIEPVVRRDLGNSKLNAIFERLTCENRIVVQGYCLKLSNLEIFDRVFKLILTLQTPVNFREKRIVANYEVGGEHRHLNFYHRETAPASLYESEGLLIPPKTTVVLELSPDLKTSQVIDIRGLASIEASDGILGTILLDPERRETFIPDSHSSLDLTKTPLEQWSYGLGPRTAVI